MNKYAEVDSSEFPIVNVVFTGEKATAENFPAYLEAVEKVYESKEPLAIIFDASKAVFPGITYQKMQAQWLKDNEKMIKTHCRGTAYVIPNLIIRNVLNAIFSFQKQPVDYLVSRDYKDALAWVKNQLELPRP